MRPVKFHVKVLAQELSKNETRRMISLKIISYDQFSDGPQQMREMLEKNSSLTRLELICVQLEDIGVNQIFRGVKKSVSLICLVLQHVYMTEASAEALCQLLRDNHNLRELGLAGNDFKDDAAAMVAEVAMDEKRLTKLNLGCTQKQKRESAQHGSVMCKVR